MANVIDSDIDPSRTVPQRCYRLQRVAHSTLWISSVFNARLKQPDVLASWSCQGSQQEKAKFQDQLFTKFQDNFRTFFSRGTSAATIVTSVDDCSRWPAQLSWQEHGVLPAQWTEPNFCTGLDRDRPSHGFHSGFYPNYFGEENRESRTHLYAASTVTMVMTPTPRWPSPFLAIR